MTSGLAALIQETSPLAPYKIQHSTKRKANVFTDIQQHALKFFIEIDSFQDPQIDSHGKTSQIDSFQDPNIVYYFGLISRPLCFTPKPDSLQDPQQ